MTIVWKQSSSDFKTAEEFPLPILNVNSDPLRECTTLVCANTGLKGKEILEKSKVFQSMQDKQDTLFEILFYYVNPIDNSIMGFYVDDTAQNLTYAITHGVYDFALSALPVIKLRIDKPVDTFEMG